MKTARRVCKTQKLTYVSDSEPGIHRIRRGSAFEYKSSSGRTIHEQATLDRIESLVIPPAWKDVWICRSARGHLQATGHDAKGRKQYRYHAEWRVGRDEDKYDDLTQFARILPRMRRRISVDLRKPGLPREKVLAAVVKLLELTSIRVGNDEYAQSNQSFGLTTMRDRHAQVVGARIQFDFRGKSGVHHQIELKHARLASIVKECQKLPGREIFAYKDDAGAVHDVSSIDVNEYLREIGGRDCTAKVFRTWTGTVLAARLLIRSDEFHSLKQAQSQIVQTVDRVSNILGNTRAVCRKCYVHPAVIEAYLDRSLLKMKRQHSVQRATTRLSQDEQAVLRVLKK